MQKQAFQIRAYHAERDLLPLSQIWFDASLKAHHFLGRERLNEQRRLIETLYLPKAETYVAEDETGPLGFISLLDSFIGGLFIKPEAQSKGIGRALIEKAKELKGDLTVGVYVDNQRAYGFYQSIGFVDELLQETDDEGLPFAVMTMRLNL